MKTTSFKEIFTNLNDAVDTYDRARMSPKYLEMKAKEEKIEALKLENISAIAKLKQKAVALLAMVSLVALLSLATTFSIAHAGGVFTDEQEQEMAMEYLAELNIDIASWGDSKAYYKKKIENSTDAFEMYELTKSFVYYDMKLQHFSSTDNIMQYLSDRIIAERLKHIMANKDRLIAEEMLKK